MTAESNSVLQPNGMGSETARALRGPLARRLFGNYVFQSVNWGIRLFEQLLLIPLFIHAWGTELYKDWLVVSSVVFFLGWCTFGIDDYFGNNLLRLASIGDHAGFKRELKAALFVACIISLGVSVLLYCSLLFIPIAKVLSLSAMDARTAAMIILIMTPVWVGYPIAILRAVYRAYGEFSRGECVSSVYMTLQLASVVVALGFRLSPIAVAFCYGINSALVAVFIIIDVSRRYPAVALGFAALEKREGRRVVKQSLLYFTNPLSIALTQNGALLVFGFFGIGASTTVAFNIFRVLTGLTRQLGVASFAVGSGIEMAREYAQRDHEACRRLYSSSGRIVSCLAGILAGLTIPVSAPFVNLWTQGAVAYDEALVLCFLAGIFLAAPGRISLMLLRYTNHPYAVAFASCVHSIGGMALALALVQPLGAFGVAFALAITETLGIGIYSPIAISNRFRFGALQHIASSYLAGICALALSYLVAWALFDIAQIGIVSLAVRLAVWSALVSPFCAICALSPTQRARVLFSCGMIWRRAIRTLRHV
jgi:O-antigen/teichoic acid export membrane protein